MLHLVLWIFTVDTTWLVPDNALNSTLQLTASEDIDGDGIYGELDQGEQTAATTFTDSPGYTVDFAADDPELNKGKYDPIYEKLTPFLLPVPVGVTSTVNPGVNGFGSQTSVVNDPFTDAVFGTPTGSNAGDKDAVESLTPAGMALGMVVPYEVLVIAGDAVSGEAIFEAEWDTQATNGEFGFDANFGVYAAFIDSSDSRTSVSGNEDLSWEWTWYDEHPQKDHFDGIFTISGLEANEKVVIEVWVVLEKDLAGSTGTVHAALIEGGSETVPLKQIGDFEKIDVDLEIIKSDNQDNPVIITVEDDPVNLPSDFDVTLGDSLTYTIQVTNLDDAQPASGVFVLDEFDPNTTYQSFTSN